MKSLMSAVLLTSILASGGLAQGPQRTTPGEAVKVAVVEFTPAADAAAMTDNAKRWLQSQLAATMHDTRKFDVYDTRHTRRATQGNLPLINHDSSTAAAVKIGKELGVAYVLTGNVTRYTPKGDGGFGYATIRIRLVEVATGKVTHSSETVQKGSATMNSTGEAEMQAKVMKHAIDAISTTLLAAM